ncbi:MAG: glycosyltransferase family 87 protein [Candidatus Dormibacteria bacterium]
MRPLIAGALVIVVALGTGWWWALVNELATPLSQSGHHDFFAFYSAATLVHDGRAGDLYNAGAVTTVERGIWPQPTGYAGYMPFLNPPSAAVVLSPLATLSFGGARITWFLISVAVVVGSALLLTRGHTRRVQTLGMLVALATFPAYQAFVEGQWSFVLLLGTLLALLAWRRGRQWVAGIALVVLWLKPPLLLLVLIWLLLTRRWRVAAAAVAAVIALTVITLPWTGMGANLAYLQYLVNVSAAHASGGGAAGAAAWEGAFANMEGLLGLGATLAGQANALATDIVSAVLALALIGYFAWTTQRDWLCKPIPLNVVLAALCTGLLLDPHLYAQDCVLLLLLAAVTLERLQWTRFRAGLALYAVSDETAAVAVLLVTALLMDLAAVDTYSLQGYPVPPLHLFTFALIGLIVAFTWRRLPDGVRAAAARAIPRRSR